MYLRKFKISDDHFHGFSVQVDMDNFDTTEAICDYVKTLLVDFLHKHNLANLVDIAKKKQFNIHDREFGALLLLPVEEVIYVCHHG